MAATHVQGEELAEASPLPRVLLLNPPGRRQYQRDTFCSSVSKGRYVLPAGDLILLSGQFPAERFDLEVIDAMAEGLSHDGLASRLGTARRDCVIVQSSTSSWEEDAPSFALARGLTEKLVANGDHALTHIDAVLKGDRNIDAVVTDMQSAGVADWLEGSALPVGLAVRTTLGIDQAAKRRKSDARPALAPRHELFPLDRYSVPWARQRPVTTIYTSLGCPWSCTFCLAGTERFDARPAGEVIDELRRVVAHGAREVVFFDSLFGLPRDRTLELCQAIEEELPGLQWSCFSRIDVIDEELANRLVRSGCHTVLVGIESGSDALLARMDKRQTTNDVRAAVAMMRRAGLDVGGLFLLGYPGETEPDVHLTMDFAVELELAFASFMCAVPFDGTPMGTLIRQAGYEGTFAGFDDDQQPFEANAGEVPVERLRELRDEAYRRFYLRPSYVLRRGLGVRSPEQLATLVREGGHLVAEGVSGLLQRGLGSRRT